MADHIDREITNAGLTRDYHLEEDGKMIVQHRQDVEPLLERNQALQNHDDRGYSPSGEIRRVASIPMVEIMKIMKRVGKYKLTDPEVQAEVKRMVNDGDFKKFRTAEGRV